MKLYVVFHIENDRAVIDTSFNDRPSADRYAAKHGLQVLCKGIFKAKHTETYNEFYGI
jgi:hypothetical protein